MSGGRQIPGDPHGQKEIASHEVRSQLGSFATTPAKPPESSGQTRGGSSRNKSNASPLPTPSPTQGVAGNGCVVATGAQSRQATLDSRNRVRFQDHPHHSPRSSGGGPSLTPLGSHTDAVLSSRDWWAPGGVGGPGIDRAAGFAAPVLVQSERKGVWIGGPFSLGRRRSLDAVGRESIITGRRMETPGMGETRKTT